MVQRQRADVVNQEIESYDQEYGYDGQPASCYRHGGTVLLLIFSIVTVLESASDLSKYFEISLRTVRSFA